MHIRTRVRRKNQVTRSGANKGAQSMSVWTIIQIAPVGIIVGLAAALYLGSQKFELWFLTTIPVALAFFPKRYAPKMQPPDWNILFILAFEAPSLLFAQYRANSIRTTVAMTIAVAVYFAVRITIRTELQVASMSGALALGGSWIALSGMRQFSESARILGEVGLTNLVPFRSRLISPPSPWIAGEWFTVLLLTLPFACALPGYCWQRGLRWPAALATIVPIITSATLILSLSRAVFWSTIAFIIAAGALMV